MHELVDRQNDVLITKEHGPRGLRAILVNYNLPIGKPVTESMCDECVLHEAMSIKFLKRVQWI